MNRIEALVQGVLDLPRPLLVALDVDGTISPIVRDPDTAVIPTPTLDVLGRLTKTTEVELALVTGRDFDSLRRMERLDGIWRAVEHGGVVLAPGEAPGQRALTRAQRDALRRFREWVDRNAEGAFIEYKPQAIAVHVRGIAARDPQRAERLMDEADSVAVSLGLHVRRGKALREAEAVPNDKRRALLEIFERSGSSSMLFAGDDLTDFGAIELAANHGYGAFVRSHEQRGIPPRSAVVLDSVEEVAAVLRGIADGLTL